MVGLDTTEREEAILELTSEQPPVLQLLGRLSLRVQQPLYSLDELVAMGQEEPEKLDVRLKRHGFRGYCARLKIHAPET